MNEYENLIKLMSQNIFFEDDVLGIKEKVNKGLITKTDAELQLKQLKNKGSLTLPKLNEQDWKELIHVIDESEKRLIKSSKFQFFLALFELPLLVIIILVALKLNFFTSNFEVILSIIVAITGAVITHTYFILRIHQQALTAIDRLTEKRVGILFLRIAANSNPDNVDAEKLITSGTMMFLGHHVKPAEPFSSTDKPAR